VVLIVPKFGLRATAMTDGLRQLAQRRRVVTAKLDRGYEDYLTSGISEEFWTRKSQNGRPSCRQSTLSERA
jgi:hypothetical protein